MKRSGIYAALLAAGLVALPAVSRAQTEEPVAVSVTVAPDAAEAVVGDEIQFEAEILDAEGGMVETAVVWSVDDAEIGEVNAEGLFMAKKDGSVMVIATVGALADTAVVTVTDAEIEDPPVEPVAASVTVTPDTAYVTVGEEASFSAEVSDSAGEAIDVAVVWSVDDAELGSIDENGVFTATAAGEAKVMAKAGEVEDTAVVVITAVVEEPPAVPVVASVEIVPGSAAAVIDETFQFGVETKDESGEDVEAEVVWSVSDETIGTVDETGAFTGAAEGEVYVIATCGALVDSAFVTVTVEPLIDPELPTVTLYRNKDGKINKVSDAVAEGGSVTLGGMPYPFNILNGTRLTFPEGSLNESITITFTVPKFAKIEGDDVNFDGQILNGITFDVAVDGEVVSPYYFGAPIILSMPYKHGLMRNLGLEPEDLALYFADEFGEIEIDSGIGDIEVDEETDMITGSVAHFSTIVVAAKSAAPAAVDEKVPAAFSLAQNVPNPFNPTTSISFVVPSDGMVNLSIFNVLGQEVRTLVNGHAVAGSHSVVWNGTDDAGRRVTSGIYFYRLQTGSLSATKKLMFLK